MVMNARPLLAILQQCASILLEVTDVSAQMERAGILTKLDVSNYMGNGLFKVKKVLSVNNFCGLVCFVRSYQQMLF